MRILQTGVSHQTAPLALRERFAFPQAAIESAICTLASRPGVQECLLLSTCNRTELYVVGEDARPTIAGLERGLCELRNLEPTAETLAAMTRHAGFAAVTHLLRVAAGLESMVIGENEILGQVRSAYALAVGAGAAGPILNRLLHVAMETGKRVRSETGINRGSLSVARLAAQHLLESLADPGAGNPPRVLLVGAGGVGRQTARILRKQAPEFRLWLANRSPEAATRLAAELGQPCQPIPFAEFATRLAAADGLVTAVDSPKPLIPAAAVTRARKSAGRPRVIVDLGVPRNLDPAVRKIDPTLDVFDMDDLDRLLRQNRARRLEWLDAAEAIVAEQARKFMTWAHEREAAVVLERLRRRFEQIRRRELRRIAPRVSAEELARIDAVTRRIVRQLLADPARRFRRLAAADPRAIEGLADTFQRIFAESLAREDSGKP